MEGPEFAAAHKKMQEIKTQAKSIIDSMDIE
jgi:DNA-binding ferritin-like protein